MLRRVVAFGLLSGFFHARATAARRQRASRPILESLEGRKLLARFEIEGGAAIRSYVNATGQFGEERSDQSTLSLSPPPREARPSETEVTAPPYSTASARTLAAALQPPADSEKATDTFVVSIDAHATAHDRESSDADIGTSRGGDTNELIHLRIVGEEGDRDGAPVDVAVFLSYFISFYHDPSNSALGDVEARYGDETLALESRAGGLGDSESVSKHATFRSAIGRIVSVSLHARARVSGLDEFDFESANVHATMSVALKVVPDSAPPGQTPPGQTPPSQTPPGQNPPGPPPVSVTPAFYALKPGVTVPQKIAQKVNNVAARFFQKTGKMLVVTDGPRTPEQQALAIHNKLRTDGKAKTAKLYGNGENIKAIISAYQAGETKADQLELMTLVLKTQVERGKYVSQHLLDTGVDFRTKGLSEKDVKALKTLIRQEGGTSKDERDSKAGSHLHGSFPASPTGSTPLP